MRKAITIFILLNFFLVIKVFSQQTSTTPNPVQGQTSIQNSTTANPVQGQRSIQVSPSEAQKIEQLTPQQKQILQQELEKTGGQLTPEAIEAIKNRPEFKGLKPEEVIQGKRLLEEKAEMSPKVEEKEGRKLESLFNKNLAPTSGALKVSTKLSPFGYSMFKRSFAQPLPAQPVAPDYIIGPGDEIQILLWGRVNTTYTLKVGQDGRILFPQIGPLTVAGMSYDEMKNFLTQQATRIIGANVAITLSRLRQIQVFVLGEVQSPGPYNINAMSTMLDALLAAGGPTERGSLRKVSLKRNGKVISILDVYDLLLKGDKNKDKRLKHGDIVYVPLVGPLVGIAGNVRRPAIYELKKETNLNQAIKLAGGLLPVAWNQMIQVERIENNSRKIVLDISASDEKKMKDFKLKDGDLIKVFSVLPEAVNRIELIGNVARPGIYAYHQGMRLSEIIKNTKDLLPDTYLDYALIKRYIFETGETKLVPFRLKDVCLKKKDVALQPKDKIYVFSKWFFEPKPTASVEGEVRKPGSYQIPEKNFRVKDLILLSGGLTKNAYLDKAEIYRLDKREKKRFLITFNLKKAMAGDPEHNIQLEDLDRVVIHSIWEYLPKQTVSIYGEVNKPGEYTFTPGMRIKDLVFAGGNIKESAYLREAELSSYKIINGELCEIDHRKINLKKALEGDPKNNIFLKPYDRLFVKKISEWQRIEYVDISGEVLFPGRYVIKKGERLSSVLKRAGGFTDKAYLKGAVFTRKRVQELQQRQINEMIDRLERELMVGGIAKTGTAITSEEAKISAEEAKMKREFLERLRNIKAKGRLVIHLRPLEEFKGTPDDIELEDGDKLYIPSNPQTIQVVGAVYNPTAFIYTPGTDISYYIEKAGGYTRTADKKKLYVLKVDGTGIRPGSWPSRTFWWEPRHRTMLDPGDTIVVPERLEKIAWIRNIKDITTILYQLAVTAGVVIAAY